MNRRNFLRLSLAAIAAAPAGVGRTVGIDVARTITVCAGELVIVPKGWKVATPSILRGLTILRTQLSCRPGE